MTSLSRIIEPGALEELPIFPLPGIVLFPHALLPLHVFEPRYRAMVKHCIDRQTPLGIAMIRPGYEGEHLGRPPLMSSFGVGRLIATSALEDGRYFIMLRGLVRARLVEELDTEHPFRMVKASVMPDELGDPAQLRSSVATVRACATSLVSVRPEVAQIAAQVVQQSSHASELADRLAPELFDEAPERQALLETSDVQLRLDAIIEKMISLIGDGYDGSAVN